MIRNTRFIGITVVLVILFACGTAAAEDGGLTPGLIEQVQNSFTMDSQSRALYNAITNNDIKDLALNRDLLRSHNELFSHKIESGSITDQESSGRCWIFAGLNLMRPIVAEKYNLEDFEFSHIYLTFWDKLEKANCFLEQMIEFRDRDIYDRELVILLEDPISDGGWWQYVVALIEKYGVVPDDVMPETNSSENTGMMNSLLGRLLRADAVKIRNMAAEGATIETLRQEKQKMLEDVYRMLVLNLGEPPTEFNWRYEEKDSSLSPQKSYSPLSFYEKFVAIDLNDYVAILTDPAKELGKHYEIRLSRNMYDGRDVDFVTAECRMLKEAAAKSVLDDNPVWFACDVGKDQDSKDGIMAMGIYDYGSIYGIDMKMTKAEQTLYRESMADHAMVFIGIDMINDKPAKWLVENSWGDKSGSDGYWTLYDSWFDSHVFEVVVMKKYVPKEVLAIFEQPAIVLPPWDPMFEMIK